MKKISKGIIVGGNEKSAWLIPWWWKYYSRHNDYKVVFVDFGLSEASKNLCKTFADVIEIDDQKNLIAGKDSIEENLRAEWESIYGSNVWQSRLGWFLKPFALLETPFENTIWLDLDCEVLGSLEPVFETLEKGAEFSVAQDLSRPGIYNSGVVVYKKQSELLKNWAECCIKNNHQFLSDDTALSSLIEVSDKRFQELIYNYHQIPSNITSEAVIIHWMSNWGKQFIEFYGGYQGYKDYLLNAS